MKPFLLVLLAGVLLGGYCLVAKADGVGTVQLFLNDGAATSSRGWRQCAIRLVGCQTYYCFLLHHLSFVKNTNSDLNAVEQSFHEFVRHAIA